MNTDLVTVVIPTIPPRRELLGQAVVSTLNQTLPPVALSVAVDTQREGVWATRQRALDAVHTPWVAFLDDDDLWYDHHLATLLGLARDHQADFTYSWFDGNNPFPMHRGRQMDPADPHHTTMTVLVRTALAKEVGFRPHADANPEWPGEDWNFIQGCVASGARFAGTSEVTWLYRLWSGNTSGMPTRW